MLPSTRPLRSFLARDKKQDGDRLTHGFLSQRLRALLQVSMPLSTTGQVKVFLFGLQTVLRKKKRSSTELAGFSDTRLSNNNNKAIENFFRVCIASSKHEGGWENSRILSTPACQKRGKNFTQDFFFISLSDKVMPSCVFYSACVFLLRVFLALRGEEIAKHQIKIWKICLHFLNICT